MLSRPCDAKSSNAGFLILFEMGNEAGSLSTYEVRISLPLGADGFPGNCLKAYQVLQREHTSFAGKPPMLGQALLRS